MPTGSATRNFDVVAAVRFPHLEAEGVQLTAIVRVLVRAILGIALIGIPTDVPDFDLAGILPAGGQLAQFLRLRHGERQIEHPPGRRALRDRPVRVERPRGARGGTHAIAQHRAGANGGVGQR